MVVLFPSPILGRRPRVHWVHFAGFAFKQLSLFLRYPGCTTLKELLLLDLYAHLYDTCRHNR
jgi:hypothetical protein